MKKITTFFLALVMVLSMSAVCFADDAHKGQALITYYNNDLEKYIENQWVSLDDVQDLIMNSCAEHHGKHCYVDLNNQELKISKEIYLDYGEFELRISNGTINAQEKCRIFYVVDADTEIYLENVTLTGGRAKDGAAFYVDDENVTIAQPKGKKDVKITNCKASNCGGAIRVNGYGWSTKIYNIIFEDCSAEDDGGALELDATVTVDNCEFRKCKAADYGGAIYIWNDNPSIQSCFFKDNTAVKEGNDIYIDDYATVTSCTFDTYDEAKAIGYSDKSYYSRNNNTFAKTAGTGTILSQGTLWIVIGIVVIALAAIAIVFSRKKKNGSAA